MRQHLDNKSGFGPPRPCAKRRQRTVLTLIATFALALSTLVAATVVSIGMARADILVAARSGDGTLAILFLAGTIIAGAVVGAIIRRRQQRPH